MSQIDDFFRSRLDQMIDLRKPLAVLATHIPWQELEASPSVTIDVRSSENRN